MRLFLALLFATLSVLFWMDELAHGAVNKFADDVQICSGRPWIDVTCNGADPTDVADSTTAINNTFNTAITNGWPVFFPPGSYKVTSKLSVNFQGQAANGLNVISNGASIDGRTIASGNVLQFFCSGGTTLSPVVCNGLQLAGQLTVAGNTAAYVVVIGNTDFSDQQNGVRIEHLVVTNTGAGGAIQANYLTAGNLWMSGSTAGGSSSVGAVALEQVQTSRIGGWGSAAGASAPALLIETGSSVGNNFSGFAYDPNTNTCVSVPSAAATRNTWVSPYFPCTTAVSAPNGPNQNVLLGPSFVGTNMGPTSIGFAMVGRGSLSRFSAPTTASLTLAGVDDGTMFSSANGTGPLTQFTAASLPVTLPNPTSVGVGWTAGFVTDNGKAVVLTVSAGKILAGDRQFTTMTVGASGATAFESAVLQSDGTNLRIIHMSQATALLNGMQAAAPARWVYPGGPGYQTTLGDNGDVVSSAQTSAGLAVTLPSTTAVSPGWMVGLSSSAGKSISVQTNGVSGGSISGYGIQTLTTITLPNPSTSWVQFDGTSFWVVNSNVPPPGTQAIDSKTSAITTEGAVFSALSQPGITANQIFNWTQFLPATNTSYDQVRSVLLAPQGSTTNLVNNFGAYSQCDESTGVYPTCVQYFGAGALTRNGAQGWGINLTYTDEIGSLIPGSPGSSTNRAFTLAEFDAQFKSPNNSGFGVLVQGNSIIQPAGFVAFSCGPLSLTPFVNGTTMPAAASQCFQTADGAATAALVIGRLTTVNPAVHPQSNLTSQPIALGYTTPTNGNCNGVASCKPQNVQITAVPGPTNSGAIGGGLKFTNTEGLITYVTDPGGFAVRGGVDQNLLIGGPIDLGDGMSMFSIPDTNIGLRSLEIVATNLSLRGSVLVSVVGPGLQIPTSTPGSSSASCTSGQITFDGNFVYACINTNVWRRAALSAF